MKYKDNKCLSPESMMMYGVSILFMITLMEMLYIVPIGIFVIAATISIFLNFRGVFDSIAFKKLNKNDNFKRYDEILDTSFIIFILLAFSVTLLFKIYGNHISPNVFNYKTIFWVIYLYMNFSIYSFKYIINKTEIDNDY
jgi:hypothetical protein